MKEYLQLFRDQAFNGAFVLLKRTLFSNIIISILLSIISILVMIPLILKGIGWTFADLIGFKAKMESMPRNITSADEVKDFFGQLFGELNFGFLAIAIFFAIIFSAYQYVAFFKLNDNAVRYDNTNFMDALKMSFNKKIVEMIGLYFSLILIFTAIMASYILVISPLFMASKVLGALVAFILFFVVILLVIRFMIAPAAMVHGNMGIFESIKYSFNKITWKRAGILFLMSLVFMIAASIVSVTINSITGAIFGFHNTNMSAIVISQVISGALGAVLGAFLYCSLTSIYFRYSNDMADESGTVEEHLIE